MTKEEYQEALKRAEMRTPSLEEFRMMEEYDDNVVWRLPQGHIVNLLDMALEENERLSKMMMVRTEWGIKDEWGAHPAADRETARTIVRNMNQSKHRAQVVWRGVTGWLNEADEFVDG